MLKLMRQNGMAKSNRREGSIERSFVEWCENNNITQMKLLNDGGGGYPDRTVFLGGGRTCLVELKRERGGRKGARQKRVIPQLRELGMDVLVSGDLEEVKRWVLEKFGSRISTN